MYGTGSMNPSMMSVPGFSLLDLAKAQSAINAGMPVSVGNGPASMSSLPLLQLLQQQQPQHSQSMFVLPTIDNRMSSLSSQGRSEERLARNRATARVRRERKKHEAEVLTKYVAGLQKRINELQTVIDSKPEEEKKRIVEEIAKCGPAPVCCQFCGVTYAKNSDRDEHISHMHANEMKAREQFLEESEKLGLDEEESADEQADEASGEAESNNETGSTNNLVRLSSEERKKRRLERNAASARLCRQRKKLYVENLRSQVPGLRHKMKSMIDAIGGDIETRLSPLPPSLDELYGDIDSASTTSQHPRTLSNFSDATVVYPDESRSEDEAIDNGGVMKRRYSISEGTIPEKKVLFTELKRSKTNSNASIPPLNGWSKAKPSESMLASRSEASLVNTRNTFPTLQAHGGNVNGFQHLLQFPAGTAPYLNSYPFAQLQHAQFAMPLHFQQQVPQRDSALMNQRISQSQLPRQTIQRPPAKSDPEVFKAALALSKIVPMN